MIDYREKYKSFLGIRFGQLIIERIFSNDEVRSLRSSHNDRAHFEVKCSCGKKYVIRIDALRKTEKCRSCALADRKREREHKLYLGRQLGRQLLIEYSRARKGTHGPVVAERKRRANERRRIIDEQKRMEKILKEIEPFLLAEKKKQSLLTKLRQRFLDRGMGRAINKYL